MNKLTIETFEQANIDPEAFDHEAHIYVGWLYVNEYELADAISRFDGALKRLVQKLGAVDKYHATLTWFYLLLINERNHQGQSWDEFKRDNPDLFDSKSTLSRYYSEDLLFSDGARRRFVLPDRQAA